jgi:hypothetical protein
MLPLSACKFHRLKPVVLALAACSGAAWSETSPWYIGASQGFTRQSNVFATATNPQSDTISSTGVLGGLDLLLGRQHLFANGTAQTNRHQNFSELNNLSYGFNGGLDWQTIERLSGTFHYTANQALVNYADIQFPTRIKDVQKTQAASTSVRYGITPEIGIDAGAAHRTVDFSAAEDKRGFRQNTASLGLRWGGTGLLTLGVGVRVTKNDYPLALVVAPIVQPPPAPIIPGEYEPDRADRKDIDFTGAWLPSGLSRLSGRISITQETHSNAHIPKLSSLTGELSWDYRPTGKLALNASIARDTGSETAFAAAAANFTPLRADNNRVNTVLSLQAKYEATAKILISANLRRVDGSIVDSIGLSNRTTTNTVALDANYAITRSIDLSCNVGYETRAQGYHANSVGCAGRITLR